MKNFLAAAMFLGLSAHAFAGNGIIVSCPECSYEGHFLVGGGMMPFRIYSTHGVFFCDSTKEFVGLAVFQDAGWGPVMEEIAALPRHDDEKLADALASLSGDERISHPRWAEFMEWYGRPDWRGGETQAMTFGELRKALEHVAVAPVGEPWHSKACEGALHPLADYENPETVCPVCGKGPVNVRDSGLMWD